MINIIVLKLLLILRLFINYINMKIPFKATAAFIITMSIFIIYLTISLLTGFTIIGNPLTYFIILLVLVEIRLLILKKKTNGIALEIVNNKIIFNNTLLLANTEVQFESVKSINTDKKYMVVDNPESLFHNPISRFINKLFNKDKIALSNISDSDIIRINQEIFKDRASLV